MKKIKKILIANRGEIAVRVIRACRELNIRTVAVYSEVDKYLPHVFLADEAVLIGAAPPGESYLNAEKNIQVALERQCQAIHPGYGFLSENAEFAAQCLEAGLIFIGPPPEALKLVGDKLRSRQTMLAHQIPIIPGMESHTRDEQEILDFANKIGFPLMVKASAGGGGKGMRIVRSEKELLPAIEAGRREALSAFGDDAVYIEKLVENPRHVEFQVVADTHGNIVHLFERECSIQRRHQKIIEETPSPALTDDLRQQMGEIACKVMQAVGYQNAGTVEFLLDENKNFYFLEVNARIQVEHPITEMVTGVDLVKQQIAIAEGAPLPFTQNDLRQRGHAIECRVYAEDPENNFYPSIGKLLYIHEPTGPGIRCDSGIRSGLEITPYYDPILSKLIVWDSNREFAIRKMIRALEDYVILGIKTPLPFLREVLKHPKFQSGEINTRFIEEHFPNWKMKTEENLMEIGLLATFLLETKPSRNGKPISETTRAASPWEMIGKWELLKGSK